MFQGIPDESTSKRRCVHTGLEHVEPSHEIPLITDNVLMFQGIPDESTSKRRCVHTGLEHVEPSHEIPLITDNVLMFQGIPDESTSKRRCVHTGLEHVEPSHEMVAMQEVNHNQLSIQNPHYVQQNVRPLDVCTCQG